MQVFGKSVLVLDLFSTSSSPSCCRGWWLFVSLKLGEVVADREICAFASDVQAMRPQPHASSARPSFRRNKLALLAALLTSAAFSACPVTVLGALGGRRDAKPTALAHQSIIGGVPAADGAFPSLAYILDAHGKYVYQCTGTVVAPSLILTAGHCAENIKSGAVFKASGYRVVTGTVDPMLPDPHVSTVVGVIVYPGLIRRVDDGDAALLVLSTPTAAPAITLDSSADNPPRAGAPAVIAGWGLTSVKQTLLTERLRSAVTVVQGRKWCTANAPPFYPKREICTITAPSYATGACSGDSGGPLLVQSPTGGEFVQVGIAIHVYGQCSTRRPSVFASIRSISSWLRTWIDAYRLPPSPPPAPPPASSPPPSPTSPLSLAP
jgi:secreted trypsin-like serine protease